MDASERLWREEQQQYGWELPAPAPWPFRLPIIRNIRGAWARYHIEQYASAWASVGIGLGPPNQYDKWVVYAIHRGWC
jgi:hypothetical protein